MRAERMQAARESFNKILTALDGAEFLQAVGDCLLAAYRRQQRELADDWLLAVWPRLHQLMELRNLTAAAGNFLQRLAFIICDRQIEEAQAVLQSLALHFVRSHDGETGELDIFWQEWLSLMARMARRNWRSETKFLLRLFLRCLLREQPKQQAIRLLPLQLHFVVYARWDGFSHACMAYEELIYFYLLLLRRAGKAHWLDVQQELLQLVLRSMRDIVAQSSRSLMQDDMDIFRLWYQFFWQLAGENVQRKQQLQQLLQLAISYWQSTRPKTSKKQVRYLEDLLQPSLINKHYAELMQKIC